MNRFREICIKLFILPVWLVVLMVIASAVSLVAVFVNGWNTSVIAYVVYVCSFYTLTVLCTVCVKYIPSYYRNIKGKVYENKYAGRYLTDVAYKTHVSLNLSLTVNVLYIATNAVSAYIYKTHWFAIFAIYYAILAVMRFLLSAYARKNNIGEDSLGELRRSRMCACILMTVNIILSGVVLMMTYYDRGFEYQGILIYVMAVYAFYTTAAAVRDLIKYRRYNSPVMSMTKVIKLAASLFSMLFLETAMFAQFGADTPAEVKGIMIMATGAGICVIVVSMSIYMIIRCTKGISLYRRQAEDV